MIQPSEKRLGLPLRRLLQLAFAVAVALFASACETTGGSARGSASTAGNLPASAINHPAVKSRNAQIAMEAPGDYYIGRRWYTEGTRYWGYLRRPRQPWSEAKLVIMNESVQKQPDRLPEVGAPQVHGFDDNHEYRIWGNFTGRVVYDPNSNFRIPEFRLTRYEHVSSNPGFLFWPGEQRGLRRLPPLHPPTF